MHIQKFQNENSHWYWRLVADNGKSIAIGGEGYVDERDCNRAIHLVKANMAPAEVKKQTVWGWVSDTSFTTAANALGLMGRPISI